MSSGMHRLKAIFLGGVTAITSSVIVLGSFVLAFSETGRSLAIAPSPTIQATSLPTRLPPPTVTPTIPPSPTPTATPTSTATPTPTCPEPPDDWIPITARRGETLKKFAEMYGTTQRDLVDVNCLTVSQFKGGEVLYVPGVSPTEPTERCVKQTDWYIYIVQRGDTLFSLSRQLGISVKQLMDANCLSTYDIYVNQKLYVPYPLSPRPNPTQRPKDTQPPRPTKTQPPPPTPTEIFISPPTPAPPSAYLGNYLSAMNV